MTIKLQTVEIQGYTVRKFNIYEISELIKRFHGALKLIEGLNSDDAMEAIGNLFANYLPELIYAVSLATDKDIEEIKKINNMDLFSDLVVAITQVNDFLALGAAVKKVMGTMSSQPQN